MVSSLLRASLACAAIILSQATAAQPPSTVPRELTLAAAIDLALTRNRALAASRYDLTAAQSRVVQAGLRPNPELTLELENFAGNGEFEGTDALETTLALSQVIELGGKRRARQDAASADVEVVTIEQRALELDLLAEVARRFIDVVAAQERVALARETSRLTQQTLDAIITRVRAARSPVAEESRARIALTRATLLERQADAALRGARYTLAALWGDTEPLFGTASADLFGFNPILPFPELLQRIERNPDLTRFASATRLADAELRLARAQARPNIALQLGVRRFEASDDAALVAGFAMPLRLFDRNQGAIREAEVRRAQVDAQRQSEFTRARASLYGLYQEVTAARERAQALRGEALPQAQTAFQQTRDGYERGRFSFLELSTAQQEVLEIQVAAIDAAADYHTLAAELERLTNEPLTTPIPEGPLP